MTYERKEIRLLSDFLTAKIYARRKWNNILKILKETKCEQKILYPVRLTPTVINMQELREYCSHGPLLKCLLEIKSTRNIRETLMQEFVVNLK